jgi:2-dehydropantoate 2-reductase
LEAGHDVSFIARSDLDFLHRNGLTVDSVDGNMRFDNIKAVGKADEVGEVDWVVMALKTYALQEAPEMIKPLVGPNTRILPIMNGFGIEDKLASSLDPARIFGAMAFVCIYREDGICKHVAYGALQAGHYLDDPAELAIVSNLFAGSNVQFTPVRCLRTARWEKLCWNIPFNGLAVGMGGVSTDKICNDPDLRALAKELMNEVVSASHLDAEARGIPRELRLDREAIVQKMFALTDTMGPYEPSTMIDLIKGRPLEV